jgi:hypothetical protein
MKKLFFIFIVAILAGLLIYFFPNEDKKEKETQQQYPTWSEQARQRQTERLPEKKEFSDGLGAPTTAQEFGWDERDDGVAALRIFVLDINRDGLADKITKTRYENGTQPGYWDYRIELANVDSLIDITPEDMMTAEGESCDLQLIKFSLSPRFEITKIWREIESDWDEPTLAQKTTYVLQGNSFVNSGIVPLQAVCNVGDLF